MGIIGRIRKHSWVAVLIVGIAILAFILGDLTKNTNKIPDVGRVNSSVMTSQRWAELVDEMETNYKAQQQTAQIPANVESQIRNEVWQRFVNETLMEEQLGKLGLQVTPAEVSDMYNGTFIHPYLRQMFTNPQTGVYDVNQVNRLIDDFDQLDTNTRMQWVEIEKYVRTDRESQKYNNLLNGSFYMPKAISEMIAAYGSEVSDVRVAALPFASVSDDEATINDDDYKAFYDEHYKEFRVYEEMRNIEFITFPVNPTAADLAAIQADVQKTWEDFREVPEDEVAFFVNAESATRYDSAYVKASSFKAPFDEMVASAQAGTMIEPVLVGNQWMMARVLGSEVRPDSLRASTIYILNQKAGGSITRSNEQAKQLADSVLALVNGKKMTFEEAVEQFSDDPQKGETKGDMDWQLDGSYGFLN